MLCSAAFGFSVALLVYLLTRSRPKASGSTGFYFADDDDADDGDPRFTTGDVRRFLGNPGEMWARNPGRAAHIASMLDDATNDGE